MGNVVNRVFDSSGPEGKVRGTPQQIIDKYLVLARDAQLGNDRVAAENFLQHAEHYTRMLSEAQRDARDAESRREGQGGPNRARGQEDGGGETASQDSPGNGTSGADDPSAQRDAPASGQEARGDASVIDFDGGDGDGSSLVDTPETGANPAADAPEGDAADPEAADPEAGARKGRAPARRRNPAKSKKSDGNSGQDGGDGAEDGAGPQKNSVAK